MPFQVNYCRFRGDKFLANDSFDGGAAAHPNPEAPNSKIIAKNADIEPNLHDEF